MPRIQSYCQKKKTAKGWRRYVSGWLTRVQNSGGTRGFKGNTPAPQTPQPAGPAMSTEERKKAWARDQFLARSSEERAKLIAIHPKNQQFQDELDAVAGGRVEQGVNGCAGRDETPEPIPFLLSVNDRPLESLVGPKRGSEVSRKETDSTVAL